MYLFDTNLCSRIMAADPAVLVRLTATQGEQVATSVVVRGELVFMAENSRRRASNLALVHSFLQGMVIYPIDDATAIQHDLTLVSSDSDFARLRKVHAIKIESW